MKEMDSNCDTWGQIRSCRQVMPDRQLGADQQHVILQLQARNAKLENELLARDERIAQLTAFSHGIAHSLKGFLSGMVGYSDLLVDFFETQDVTERAYAEQVRDISEKMAHFLDALLVFASLQQIEFVPQPLDMAAIVSEAEQRLSPAIVQAQAELVKPTSWPTVLGHAIWVEEVWANYISNALKYAGHPDKGILPRVELGWDLVAASSATADHASGSTAYRFWVRDQGPGIALDQQAHLFTPFTRLTVLRGQGHGLGLSIVKEILERLGGKVGVESAADQGALFFFTLPAATEPHT